MRNYKCCISLGSFALTIALLLLLAVGCSEEEKQIPKEQVSVDVKNEAQVLINQYLKDEAQALLDERKYEQAYEKFNSLARDEKLRTDFLDESMFKAGYCLQQLNKHDEALHQYVNLIEQFPQNYYVVGRFQALDQINFLIVLETLDYKGAVAEFEKLLNSENLQNRKIREWAQLCIMQLHYQQRDYRATLNAYFHLAIDFSQGNKYDSSRNIEPYNRNFKENMWYIIGDAHYQLKNYKAARQAFREFLKLLPIFDSDLYDNPNVKAQETAFGISFNDRTENHRDLEARHLIAQSFLEEKDYAQAYLAFDKLVTEEFRTDSENRAKTRDLLEWYGTEDFKNNSENDPIDQVIQDQVKFDTVNSYQLDMLKEKKYAEAMYKAAYCLKELRVGEEALARYTEFMTQFPDSEYVADAYLGKGEIYVSQKDYDSARLNYNFALRSIVNDVNRQAEIQLAIGRTYYDQDDYKNAIKEFNKLLKEYPKSNFVVMANILIASSYNQREKLEDAINTYKGIIETYGKKEINGMIAVDINGYPKKTHLIAFCTYEIGKAYSDIGKSAEALSWYQKNVNDFPKDIVAPDALYGALLALKKLGNKEQLEEIARKYLNDREKDDVFLATNIKKEVSIKSEEVKNSFDTVFTFAKNELNRTKYKNEKKINALLLNEARLNLAKIKREEFGDIEGAAKEFTKLANYRPIPDPRLNLIKLQGKYYEGLCYQELGSLADANSAYQKAIALFNTNFQPFIDNPNIDVPNIDGKVITYCIQKGKEYAEKIRQKLKGTEQKTGDKIDKAMDSSNEKQLTAEDIADIASGSTVYIETETAKGEQHSGSGFFVRPGLIATNHHVIKGTVRATVRLGGTNRKYAIVGYTAVDPDRDLAILKVRAFGVKSLPLGNSEEVKQGEPVYAVGNPLNLVNVVSDGQISSVQWVESIKAFLSNKSELVSDVQRENTPHKLLMMTAPISGGNSGGPVLNSRKEVIGISVASNYGTWTRYPVIDEEGHNVKPARYVKVISHNAQNLNYAVPVNYLKALLKRTGPPKPLSDLEVAY